MQGNKKHGILLASAATSKQPSPSAPRRCEEGGTDFPLDRPGGLQPAVTEGRPRLGSDRSDVSVGGRGSGRDTPSLADHSSNNTPNTQRR